MPVAPDVQSLTTKAEEAASADDFASAEHYLKLAVELQASGTGALPAELANTLNNLGVVYERLEKPVEAERCYRRAHAVARAVLDPDHPSVLLSEKNLREFCEGRGIPFEETPAEPAPAPAPISPPQVSQPRMSQPPAPEPPAPTVEPVAASRTPALVLAGIAALALAAVALIGIRSFGTGEPDRTPESSPAESTPAPTAETAPAPETPAAPEPAASVPVAPEPATAEPAAPVAERAPVSPPPEAVRPAPARTASPAVVPTVVSASLCGTLNTRGAEWQCGPATGGPGTYFFVTRLAAPAATSVEHRWYRDGRVHQAVPLRVAANPQHGYRTYSRLAISAERAGEWRAELRSAGGAVLHEERFTVGVARQ